MKLTLDERVTRLKKRAISLALRRANGNLTEAALRLGVTVRKVRHNAKLLGVPFQDWRIHNTAPDPTRYGTLAQFRGEA